MDRLDSTSEFESLAGYCRATRSGKAIFVSGTVASVVGDETLFDLDTYVQCTRALKSALSAVQEIGDDSAAIMRTRLYLAPTAVWEEAARAHSAMLGATPPANTTLYVARLIPPGALIEVEVDAVLDESKK